MPYRRLPNTDKSRLQAMHTACELSRTVPLESLAYSMGTKVRIQNFLPKFEMTVKSQKDAQKKQAERSKKYICLQKKAKLYISHFIQALNMCIIREEIKGNCRELYGLKTGSKTVPPLSTEKQILDWGKRIIEGERKRMSKGGKAIYTPSIALVKVHYENFRQSYFLKEQMHKDTDRLNKQVASMREEADSHISALWNEIEAHFSYINNDTERRKKCEEYGIKYIFRKSELKKSEIEESKIIKENSFI